MERIVFFDGVCGLCNIFVDLLFKIDRNALFKVAPLQGETARRLLPAHRVEDLDTVILFESGTLYTKSNAIIKILSFTGKLGFLAALGLRVFPRIIRDLVYDFIVNSRYSVYGKRDTCRLPTEDEKKRFLP